MRRALGALTVVAAMGFLLAGVTPASAATTFCDDGGNVGVAIPPNSTVNGSLTVPSGVECTLHNVRVGGSVTQLDGSLFWARNGSRIGGSITSTNAWEFLLEDATVVGGSVTIKNIGTGITHGGGTLICGRIGGDLTITGTTTDMYWTIGDDANEAGPCAAGAKLKIGGSFTYNDNKGGADVFHLRVGNLISCTGNATPFSGARPVWVFDNKAGSKAGPHHDGQLGDCAV